MDDDKKNISQVNNVNRFKTSFVHVFQYSLSMNIMRVDISTYLLNMYYNSYIHVIHSS